MSQSITNSPRCVLADRDVNKLVASPGKRYRFGASTEQDSTKGNSLILPSMESSSRSPASGKKRNATVLDEGVEVTRNKRTAVEESSFEQKAEATVDMGNDARNAVCEEEDGASSQGSLSPSTSFDDSQNTTVTEPDDVMPLALHMPTFQFIAPPRTITKLEARTNAATLRLRLEFAMYKIRTNQTDTPLSQLQLPLDSSPRSRQSSQRHTNSKASLPALRRLDEQTLPLLKPGRREEQKQSDVMDIPSSPPPTPAPKTFATPVLPRSRDGLLHIEESPEKRLTSSVVKGRAADGLLSLSLMGGTRR